MDLILASASPRRQDILTHMGVPFIMQPADIDEIPHKDESGRQFAIRMAYEKAHAIPLHQNTIILSADTVVCTARKILPKALDKDTAKHCITHLMGRRHKVYTAMCLITPKHAHQAVVKTVVQFKNLDTSEISTYIQQGDWYSKAGGYAIQGYASRYISYMGGSYSAVVGLDIHTVYKWLRLYGIGE